MGTLPPNIWWPKVWEVEDVVGSIESKGYKQEIFFPSNNLVAINYIHNVVQSLPLFSKPSHHAKEKLVTIKQ